MIANWFIAWEHLYFLGYSGIGWPDSIERTNHNVILLRWNWLPSSEDQGVCPVVTFSWDPVYTGYLTEPDGSQYMDHNEGPVDRQTFVERVLHLDRTRKRSETERGALRDKLPTGDIEWWFWKGRDDSGVLE